MVRNIGRMTYDFFDTLRSTLKPTFGLRDCFVGGAYLERDCPSGEGGPDPRGWAWGVVGRSLSGVIEGATRRLAAVFQVSQVPRSWHFPS